MAQPLFRHSPLDLQFRFRDPRYSALLFHRVEHHPSFTLPPSSYVTLPRLSNICRAASRHPFCKHPFRKPLCNARIRTLQSVFSVLASFAFWRTREKIEDAEEDLRRIPEVVYFFWSGYGIRKRYFCSKRKVMNLRSNAVNSKYSLIFITNVTDILIMIYLFCILLCQISSSFFWKCIKLFFWNIKSDMNVLFDVRSHVQSKLYFLSYSQEGRKRRKTGMKKAAAIMPEKKLAYRGNDFIQSVMPLILINNRPLDSRRTNGLIDRDATRKSGRCGNMWADLLASYGSVPFLFPSPLFPVFEITNNAIIAKEGMKDIKYAISVQELK